VDGESQESQGPEPPAAILRVLIAGGHELGLTVVAEGVETHEESDFVRTHAATRCRSFSSARRFPRRVG
jgi:EAL domain-containing protein (putative c-di-GMP-specific phosphodiesterase class I)